jgi:hypothetical protein
VNNRRYIAALYKIAEIVDAGIGDTSGDFFAAGDTVTRTKQTGYTATYRAGHIHIMLFIRPAGWPDIVGMEYCFSQ